jgi:hypothetical protein
MQGFRIFINILVAGNGYKVRRKIKYQKSKCKNKGVKRISPVEVLYKHINSYALGI